MIEINSIVDEMAKRQAEREKQEQVVVENITEYKAALDRIFSTSEGKLMAKYMLKFCKVFTDDDQLNPAKLVEDKGKRAYYLKMIRPFVARELIQEIENQ